MFHRLREISFRVQHLTEIEMSADFVGTQFQSRAIVRDCLRQLPSHVQGDGQAEVRVAQVSFSIEGPGVDPNDFRITQFAGGLNYPVGMVELDDGSLLVATSNGNNFFGSSSGSLLRLADSNGDGVADSSETLVNNVPGGKLSALRRSGDLVSVTGQGSGVPISIYRLGAAANDP